MTLPVSVDRRTVGTWTEGIIQILDCTYVLSWALVKFNVLGVQPSVDDENVHINACDSVNVIEMNA
jgi:hypothetical protein